MEESQTGFNFSELEDEDNLPPGGEALAFHPVSTIATLDSFDISFEEDEDLPAGAENGDLPPESTAPAPVASADVLLSDDNDIDILALTAEPSSAETVVSGNAAADEEISAGRDAAVPVREELPPPPDDDAVVDSFLKVFKEKKSHSQSPRRSRSSDDFTATANSVTDVYAPDTSEATVVAEAATVASENAPFERSDAQPEIPTVRKHHPARREKSPSEQLQPETLSWLKRLRGMFGKFSDIGTWVHLWGRNPSEAGLSPHGGKNIRPAKEPPLAVTAKNPPQPAEDDVPSSDYSGDTEETGDRLAETGENTFTGDIADDTLATLIAPSVEPSGTTAAEKSAKDIFAEGLLNDGEDSAAYDEDFDILSSLDGVSTSEETLIEDVVEDPTAATRRTSPADEFGDEIGGEDFWKTAPDTASSPCEEGFVKITSKRESGKPKDNDGAWAKIERKPDHETTWHKITGVPGSSEIAPDDDWAIVSNSDLPKGADDWDLSVGKESGEDTMPSLTALFGAVPGKSGDANDEAEMAAENALDEEFDAIPETGNKSLDAVLAAAEVKKRPAESQPAGAEAGIFPNDGEFPKFDDGGGWDDFPADNLDDNNDWGDVPVAGGAEDDAFSAESPSSSALPAAEQREDVPGMTLPPVIANIWTKCHALLDTLKRKFAKSADDAGDAAGKQTAQQWQEAENQNEKSPVPPGEDEIIGLPETPVEEAGNWDAAEKAPAADDSPPAPEAESGGDDWASASQPLVPLDTGALNVSGDALLSADNPLDNLDGVFDANTQETGEEENASAEPPANRLKVFRETAKHWAKLAYDYLDERLHFQKNWWLMVDGLAIIILTVACAGFVAYYLYYA